MTAAPVASVPDDPARSSCRSSIEPTRHPLQRALQRVEIGDRTFVAAWRRRKHDVETVIASLDAAGGLVVTPVPIPYADSLALGADDGGLVLVSVALRGKGSLLRVALQPDGSLVPDKPTPLPEVAWGWPQTLLSDGTRAILRHDLATPEQTIGETVLHTIDLATRRVVDTHAVPVGADVQCDAGGCTTLTVTPAAGPGEPARIVLVHRTPAGDEDRREFEVRGDCPTPYSFAAGDERVVVFAGDPWRALTVASEPPFFREAAVDRELAPQTECGPALHDFASTRHPGLLDGHKAPRALLRWDPKLRRFGVRDALPDMSFWQSERFAHADGVLEIAWTGGSGMQHSPTDDRGTRRYYRHWFFDGGEIALLRREHGRWSAVDRGPLAITGARGRTHDGYHPTLLRNGLHAAVLLTPAGGVEDAWLQPYLAPCPGT